MSVKAGQAHIGSVIGIPSSTDVQVNSPYDEKPHLVAKVKLVGEVVFARSVVESDIGALNSAAVILSPALTRVLVPQCAYLSETSLRLAGGDSNATRVLSRSEEHTSEL